MNPTTGAIFQDKYEVLDLIGEGGMGSVYKARNLETNKLVAIKLMQQIHIEDEENVKRFRREAKTLARLNQENIVSFYEFGIDSDGIPYTVMEFLEGKSLNKILRQENFLSPERSLNLLKQVCQGMAYAHQQGMLHRDLTPSNILVSVENGKETVKLVDFGLVKLTDKSGLATEKLTKTGLLLGSLHYMSPEQSRGMPVDARTDIYAAGCILYEMLSGEKPFDADNPVGLLYKQCNEQSKRFSDTEFGNNCPESVESICKMAMQKRPELRYQSMAEMIHDLEVASSGQGKLIAPPMAVYAQQEEAAAAEVEALASKALTQQSKKSTSGRAILIFSIGFTSALLLSPIIYQQITRMLPTKERVIVEVAKQQLFSDPNAKLWLEEAETQVGPKTKAWVLEQENPHTGKWTVYVAPEGMAAVNKKMGCSLVTSAPEWKVSMYNSKTRSLFESPLSEWKGASLKSASKAGYQFANKVGVYTSALIEKKPTKLKDGDILGHKATQYLTDNLVSTGLRKVEFWTTPDIQVPTQLKQVFSKIYGVGLSSMSGRPLKVSYIDENGKRTPVFTTIGIGEKEIPLAYFSTPPSYTKVDSEIGVLMDADGRQKMQSITNESDAGQDNQDVDELLGNPPTETETKKKYKSRYNTGETGH